MNAIERLEKTNFTDCIPEEQEIRERAVDQAEGLRIATKTQAPVTAHVEETRRIVASMDEEDARAALDVLVIKHPFVVMDVLRGYFETMSVDLKELRKVFTQRESYENDICGGNRI